LIARDFNGDWSNGSIEVRPPGINYGEVLENLATLGVFRVRSKVSYDVPDLYLSGLGLSRRGGVAKE
jgi:hypothetical protein